MTGNMHGLHRKEDEECKFFDEAFKAMREGKTVYRRSYPWAKFYMKNENIFIDRGGDVSLCIELPEVIITADDWEVLE